MGRIGDILERIVGIGRQLEDPNLTIAPAISRAEVKRRAVAVLEDTLERLARLRGWVEPTAPDTDTAEAVLSVLEANRGQDSIAIQMAIERKTGSAPALSAVYVSLRMLQAEGRAYAGEMPPGCTLESSRLWFRTIDAPPPTFAKLSNNPVYCRFCGKHINGHGEGLVCIK